MIASHTVAFGGRWIVRASLLATLLITLTVACTSTPPTPSAVPSATATPGPTATSAPSAQPILYDFGDAPDPSYPTLLASNGARTRVIDQFWLGNLRSPSVTDEVEAKVVNLDELDDGMESYVTFGGESGFTFRAVKSAAAPAGVVYFNLLVDIDRDGRWQGDDWVERDLAVDLAPGEQKVIDVSAVAVAETWIRATLTDTPVAAADWDGTGEFAVGEVEDYYLPPSPPYLPPPSEPPYTPTPTPTTSPTPTPTPERTILTPSHAPTPSPSPAVVYTGDFVVVCEPDPAAVVHGESVVLRLKIVSGLHTPPERFRASVLGGDEFGGGAVAANPPAGSDGWSAWGDGASLTYTSTHIDPPARVETAYLAITLQSLSTTRTEYCAIRVTHTGPSPTAPQIQTPTIRVEPEIVNLQLVGQVRATLTGSDFTPGGRVDIRIKPPNHPATNGTESAGTDGQFSLDLFFQPNMPKGTYEVTATDRTSGATAQTTFEVR